MRANPLVSLLRLLPHRLPGGIGEMVTPDGALAYQAYIDMRRLEKRSAFRQMHGTVYLFGMNRA